MAVMDREEDIADMHFDELSEMQLEPFAYCFQDANRHRIDNVVAVAVLQRADGPRPQQSDSVGVGRVCGGW